jgi:hypothetical protein
VTIKNKFAQRFIELEAGFNALPFRQEDPHDDHRFVPDGLWHTWAISAQSLIKAVFGSDSPHYQKFTALYGQATAAEYQLLMLSAVFEAAKNDFEGGYVFDVDLRVSGEVFGDFVTLARQSLSEGHKDVAAVLASAALEDALKRFATANGLSVNGKAMQDVVNTLKSAGLVSGAQKGLLDAMPRIRNAALHAEWGKVSEADVGSVLGYVDQFLLTKFSG